MLEAINQSRVGCFGWAVKRVFDDDEDEGAEGCVRLLPDANACVHRQRRARGSVGLRRASWCWWPATDELRLHYCHDLGFWACLVQGVAATVFWIAGFAALPGIFNHLGRPLMNALYWTPQVVGGCGFVVSGWMFMVWLLCGGGEE
jgi:hypothetical protein